MTTTKFSGFLPPPPGTVTLTQPITFWPVTPTPLYGCHMIVIGSLIHTFTFLVHPILSMIANIICVWFLVILLVVLLFIIVVIVVFVVAVVVAVGVIEVSRFIFRPLGSV